MPFRTTTEAFRADTFIQLDDRFRAISQVKQVAEFARQRAEEAEQVNKAALGYVPKRRVFVDGVENAPLENVKTRNGVIEFQWEFVGPIIEDGLKILRDLSPVFTGAYRDSHTVFINGVPTDMFNDAKPSDEIMISNPVPYARRLEIGVTESGRSFVIQVPPHIYDRAAKMLRQRYDNMATITVDEVTLPDAYQIKGTVGRGGISGFHRSGARRVRRRIHTGESARSPALIIKLR